MKRHEDLCSLLLLLFAGPVTARQLADALGCSLPTVYNRLVVLESLSDGFQIEVGEDAAVRTGPKAATFKAIGVTE